MMDSQKVKDLIGKYLDEKLNETERVELDEWLKESVYNQQLFERVTDGKQLFEAAKESIIVDQKISRLLKDRHPELVVLGALPVAPVRRILWFKTASAAAVLVTVVSIGVVAYLALKSPRNETAAIVETQPVVADRAPGKNGAILKLANGEEIVLDDAGNGQLATQGNTQITKSGAVLAYNAGHGGEVHYNTLSTPRGRQFQLALPDGSKVWLNSASSITYPTSFTGKDRTVSVSGEVYLEVAEDATKPFKAKVAAATKGIEETTIEVLGTRFNINGFGDEAPIKTTLVTGKVKISKGSTMATLIPGQQAQVLADKINVSKDVDVQKETAWRNGLFNFRGDKLKNIMPQISRWYDVDVIYEDNAVQNITITGEIERGAKLSEVLKILSYLKIGYRIEGRKLILKDQGI